MINRPDAKSIEIWKIWQNYNALEKMNSISQALDGMLYSGVLTDYSSNNDNIEAELEKKNYYNGFFRLGISKVKG